MLGMPNDAPNRMTTVATTANGVIRQPETNADIASSSPAMPMDQLLVPPPIRLAVDLFLNGFQRNAFSLHALDKPRLLCPDRKDCQQEAAGQETCLSREHELD